VVRCAAEHASLKGGQVGDFLDSIYIYYGVFSMIRLFTKARFWNKGKVILNSVQDLTTRVDSADFIKI